MMAQVPARAQLKIKHPLDASKYGLSVPENAN
jgi:hypothetical protein